MDYIRVLGIDPSLRNWGYAFATININTLEFSNLSLAICTPTIDNNKQTRVNTRDEQRAFVLAEYAFQACKDNHLIFIETPVGSQSSRAQTSYGITLGIMAALRAKGFSLTPVSAKSVKLARTGNSNATKEQMIASAMQTYPQANWPTRTVKAQTLPILGKAEHMADAIGCIEAGLLTPQFTQLSQLLKNIHLQDPQ